MTRLLTIDDIAQCRHGPDNDIDLEAVYGGRISGRKEEGLKVNPIFHDSNQQIGQSQKDHNGNLNGIYLERYETFPRRKDKNGNLGTADESVSVENSKEHPVLNEPAKNLNSNDRGSSVKIMQPTLLGPGDFDTQGPDVTQQNTASGQDNMKEAVKTTILNGYQSEDILSDLKKKKAMNGNYALLGYNNEGYDRHESETGGENKPGDVSVEGQQKSLAVCNSIDSSPSKSSLSSGGSPSKNSKFLTEVSVHVIEYSVDPEQCGKLESFDSETARNADLTKLKSAAESDYPKDDRVLPQGEKSPDSKAEIQNAEIFGDEEISNEILTESSGVITDLQNVIINVDGEQSSHDTKDSEIQSMEGDDSKSKSIKYTKHGALGSSKVEKKSKKNGSKDSSDGESSTRTLKSILTNPSLDIRIKELDSDHKRSKSDSEIHEAKSVKFSKDTVFNENKPKKYKNERIDRFNLRNIYHGKISSDSAIAKLNPLFQGDLDEYDQDSLTDDEKVAYRLSVQKMLESNGKDGALNTPAYMDKYLVLRTQGLKGIDLDIETLPAVPIKDRLIERTIKKKRRKLIVKWTLVVMTVIIITATATVVGVYFKNNG